MDRKRRRFFIRTAILTILAAAVVYTLYGHLTSDEKKALASGDIAPDFVLEDLNGKPYRLSDYRGKGVLLNFWGTYCKPCKDEMPYLDRQYKKNKDQGVEILAINVGETDIVIDNFVKQYKLTFPVVVDHKTEVQTAYNILPLPTTVLIDSEGKIVKIHLGEMDEQTINHYMELIKP